MSDVQSEVRVRNVSSTPRSESFLESAVDFGGGVVRLGFSLATLPLALLPSQSRQHMRNATKELMYAFADLPRNFADIAGEEIEKWAAADDAPASAPKDEMSKG